MSIYRCFSADCRGNTGVMLALALVPILLSAGAGIDMVRANYARTVLQGAADAAALAGATSGKELKADLQEVVEEYLAANGAKDVLSYVENIDSDLDKSKGVFTVDISGKLNTGLMHLAGIQTMDLGAHSEVMMGGSGLEVALVLDNTASMNADGRLPALKVAADKLIDDLMELKDNGAYIKIGVVPFSDYVNVGTSAKTEPWIDVPPDETKVENVCYSTYPNATKSNCHMESGVYNNDGVPTNYTQEVCDWAYGEPVTACSDQTISKTWNGCVGSRNDPLDESIGNLTNRYPGLQNVNCPAELMALSDDKSDLKAKIASLTATGSTYIPAGLLWGWNLLDSSKPLTGGKTKAEMDASQGTKAIVLMTDGDNTLSVDYPWHWGNDAAAANTKTAALCTNAKDDGIMIYTVSFMVTNPTSIDLLQNCATDAAKAFNADSAAELSMAFQEIGNSMAALRLSK